MHLRLRSALAVVEWLPEEKCVRRLGGFNTPLVVSSAGVGVAAGGEPAVVRTALRPPRPRLSCMSEP